MAYAVSEGKIADANIQLAGEPTRPGAKVPRGVPKFLAALQRRRPPGRAESGRLELADWLASPRNPLTARVMVNRVWQHHFGRGIVATPSNFGKRGSPPSHPELLDWLAASFVEHGWSIKWLHRTIMASKTYQLDSLGNDKGDAIDPANQWYWRFDRQRLDAEAIRDAMLFVAGTLDLNRPGPQPFPAITQVELDAALSVQGGLSVVAPQRLPDDAAAIPASLPGPLRRSRHEHDHRRAVGLDGPDPGPVFDE